MKSVSDLSAVVHRMKPGCTIVLHSGCAEPTRLVKAVLDDAARLAGARLVTLMPMGPAPYSRPEWSPYFALATFFPGKGLRKATAENRVELLRYPLSSIPALFETREFIADVLLLRLSPPDDQGRMSLGVSVDYMRAVLGQNPLVVAEIDRSMPRTYGDTIVEEHEVDYVVESSDAPQAVPAEPPNDIDRRIAENIAGVITDGSVIQTGIGSLPDLVLGKLCHLRDLSVHTGVITDGHLPLLKSGAVTNAGKSVFPGQSITTLAAGTQALYDFLHNNRDIEFHACSVTHHRPLLANIDNLHAINSVLEVDLEGNANAEQIGPRVIACPGGLPDFAAGASASRGGASIIALRSKSPDGRRSNIRTTLDASAPVTVAAPHIDFVVTEFGVARIRGLSPGQRAKALIEIAHPDHRAELKNTPVL